MIDQDELHDGGPHANFRGFTNTSSGCLDLILGKHHRIVALECIARLSAVTETRPDVAQIAALADPLAAKGTETLSERCSAIDHYEFHVMPPKQ